MTDSMAKFGIRFGFAICWRILMLGAIVCGPLSHWSFAETLKLDQCLSLAKANCPILKQAGLSLRSAGLARQELTTTGLPQLRFSAGASYAPGTKHFGYDPAVSNLGEFGSRVILEQPLYDGGLRHLKALQADIDVSRLTKEQQLAIRDLEFEVRQSFIENLRAQEEVKLREQAVRELTDYLDLVNRLSAGGAAARTDVLRTQVELSTASTALSQSRQSLMEAKYQLAGYIGDPSDTSFIAIDSLGEFTLIQIDSASLAGAIDTSRNLELSITSLEYNRTVSEIREARKERLPTVSLVADAGWLTSRENLTTPASERYNGLGYSVGISVDMPLFDWGGRRLRVQQKQLAAESARLQSDIIRRAYETEYRSALARLASSQSQLTVLRDAIKQAEDNFLLIKSKYAAGSAAASEVLSAQQLLTESKIAELETLSDIQMVRARIKRLAGN
jgi:outer membrane protein